MLICDNSSTRNDQFCTEEPHRTLNPAYAQNYKHKVSLSKSFLMNLLILTSVIIHQVAWVRNLEGHSCYLRLSALHTQMVFKSHWPNIWNPFSPFWHSYPWLLELHIISHLNINSLLSSFPALTTNSLYILRPQWLSKEWISLFLFNEHPFFGPSVAFRT